MKKFLFFASLLGSISFAGIAATSNTVDQPSSKPVSLSKSTRKPLDVVCYTGTCDNGSSVTGCGSNADEARQAVATAFALGCGG